MRYLLVLLALVVNVGGVKTDDDDLNLMEEMLRNMLATKNSQNPSTTKLLRKGGKQLDKINRLFLKLTGTNTDDPTKNDDVGKSVTVNNNEKNFPDVVKSNEKNSDVVKVKVIENSNDNEMKNEKVNAVKSNKNDQVDAVKSDQIVGHFHPTVFPRESLEKRRALYVKIMTVVDEIAASKARERKRHERERQAKLINALNDLFEVMRREK